MRSVCALLNGVGKYYLVATNLRANSSVAPLLIAFFFVTISWTFYFLFGKGIWWKELTSSFCLEHSRLAQPLLQSRVLSDRSSIGCIMDRSTEFQLATTLKCKDAVSYLLYISCHTVLLVTKSLSICWKGALSLPSFLKDIFSVDRIPGRHEFFFHCYYMCAQSEPMLRVKKKSITLLLCWNT